MEHQTIAPEVTGLGGEDEPTQLWLVAPFRAVQGEYVLQKGRDNWNQPLWRQSKGPSWLFSSPDGFWRFANNDLELAEHLGHIQSSEPHGGKLPHQVAQWQHHDGSAWYDDSAIKVTTSPEDFDARPKGEELSSLWLVAPRYALLQGEYRKQEARTERGQPVWRQVSGEGWIFSSSKGRWNVTDFEDGIASNSSVMATASQHNGEPPYRIEQWQFFCQGSWQLDPNIFVTEKQAEAQRRMAEQQREALKRTDHAPEKVWVICPPKPNLQGEYAKQPARVERGQAVWRQVGGNGILYSNGLGGLWCVATKEADVQKNLGLLQCSTPHYGRPPHEMESWQYADGNSWRVHADLRVTVNRQEGLAALAEQDADAQRRAKAAPKQLWLKAPSRIALEGEYTKVPERLERGQAVWKQHCGPGWIYSTSGGRWFITDREDGISVCTGLIASITPHQNHFPQETEQWQEYVNGVWQPSPAVAVVVDEECLKLRHLSSLSMEDDLQAMSAVPSLKMPNNLWVMSSELSELEASAKPTRSHMSTGLASLSAGYPMPVPASECYLLGRTATFSKLAALGPRVCPSLPPGLENDQMEVLESLKAANLMHLAGLLGTPEYSKPKAAPAPITSGLPLLLSREDVAIGKVVRSQDGAEVVSRLLATDASAPPLVVTSLLPELPYLASHPNGAGVISDLFVACRKARDHGSTTIPAMTRRLQGSLLRLTKDRWGCRVMQAALEEASPEFQQAFASELQGKALKLCQHLHANFVLQKYVELLPSSAGAFILQELTPHALEVAAHVYGCRVLQRLIEHCSKEPELSKLVESLLATVPQIEKLLKDPFGSNVLRALVAHGTDAQVKVIMAAISTNVLKFAKHKPLELSDPGHGLAVVTFRVEMVCFEVPGSVVVSRSHGPLRGGGATSPLGEPYT
ncbi:unnamed protein product [Durusdinium trenchii]|uniref:PUM-HD domain-containing protein n=1 Tax=Durusdinium trenchii TaxID=1381693 RepID=A0ABP0PBW6_9DINO